LRGRGAKNRKGEEEASETVSGGKGKRPKKQKEIWEGRHSYWPKAPQRCVKEDEKGKEERYFYSEGRPGATIPLQKTEGLC